MIATIESMIGEPICLDGVTSRNIKRDLAFSRLLVEVSAMDISRKVAILQSGFLGTAHIVPSLDTLRSSILTGLGKN